jgi:hypothetical protein
MEVSGQIHACRFVLKKRAYLYHVIGGWMGPRAGLGAVRKTGSRIIVIVVYIWLKKKPRLL